MYPLGWKICPFADLLCGKRGVYRRGRRCKAGAFGKCSFLCCDPAEWKIWRQIQLYLCSLWSILNDYYQVLGATARWRRSERQQDIFLLSQKAAGGSLRGLEQKQSSRKALWIRRQAPMPPMCRHITAACRKISVICRRNLIWIWKQRKRRSKEARKNWGKDQNGSGFRAGRKSIDLSGAGGCAWGRTL